MVKLLKIQLYPDETVYSVTSRMHFLSGESDVKKTKIKLFGTSGQLCNVVWPVHLYNLSESINVSPSILLNDHTLYSFYKNFLSQRSRDLLEKSIMYGYSEARTTPDRVLGIYKKNRPKLLLCSLCVIEDINQYGEPYWHRSHHLPGTLVCEKHNIMLISECCKCRESFTLDIHGELRITPLFCSNGHQLNEYVENKNEKLLKIAKENKILLYLDKEFTVQEIREKFFQHSLIKGFWNVQSSVTRYENLYPEFLKMFPDFLLELIGEPFESKDNNNWTRTVFREKNNSMRPLHYVLFIIFFSGTVETFFYEEPKYSPFGEGPWPCLNGACAFFKRKVINEVKLEKSNVISKPTGVFHCKECCFIYSRVGPDTNCEDIYKYGWIRNTGHVWDAKLEELLKADVVYFSKIAKQLNIGAKSLKRRLKGKLQEINLIKVKNADLIKIQRNRILRLLEENPMLSRNQITKEPIKWLMANDKEWLDNILPLGRPRKTLEQRREVIIELIKNFPSATKGDLKKMNPSNYEWLCRKDKDWFLKHVPRTVALDSE